MDNNIEKQLVESLEKSIQKNGQCPLCGKKNGHKPDCLIIEYKRKNKIPCNKQILAYVCHGESRNDPGRIYECNSCHNIELMLEPWFRHAPGCLVKQIEEENKANKKGDKC